eukprot:1157307-Pelagomonas_calceolata.AAC.4
MKSVSCSNCEVLHLGIAAVRVEECMRRLPNLFPSENKDRPAGVGFGRRLPAAHAAAAQPPAPGALS